MTREPAQQEPARKEQELRYFWKESVTDGEEGSVSHQGKLPPTWVKAWVEYRVHKHIKRENKKP